MEVFGIMLEEWQVWVVLGILCLIAEIFISGFVAASISAGFFSGALASGLGLDVKWQLIFFSIGAAITFFGIRPIILKYGYKDSESVRTNADSLIGRKGRISEEVDASKGSGRISVDGDDWKAVSEDGSVIENGARAEIIDRDSIVMVVKKLN